MRKEKVLMRTLQENGWRLIWRNLKIQRTQKHCEPCEIPCDFVLKKIL